MRTDKFLSEKEYKRTDIPLSDWEQLSLFQFKRYIGSCTYLLLCERSKRKGLEYCG